MEDILVQLAKDAIAQDENFFGRTRFSISSIKPEYSYDLDPIPSSAVLTSKDPYGTPLEALIRIESLRRDFQIAATSGKFWVAPLDAVEGAVRQCVAKLEGWQPKTGRADLQQECSTIIQERFNTLESAIHQYAATQNLQLVKIQKRDPVVGYRVRIKIDPPRAHVRVMTLLDYKKYLYFNTPAERYQWNDLLDAENLMIGWYHYRADWPQDLNGPEEGDFEITKPGSITFTPKNK